jgi:long-chain acyl-CoA synthetase
MERDTPYAQVHVAVSGPATAGEAVPDSASVQEPRGADAVGSRPANLAGYVRRAAAAGPDRPALIWHDQTLSWDEVDAACDGVARALRALRLDPVGDRPPRVAIALPNSPQFATAFFGALRAGLVAVPMNPGYTARELGQVLADSAASVLVGTPEVCAAVESLRGDLPQLRGVHVDALPESDGARPDDVGGGEDLAVLLYTSGTEGRPKGAMLSHRALIANHAQLEAIEPPALAPEDRALLVVPLFHAYGLNSGLGAVAYQGASGVLVERFDPADALRLIARHQVTVVIGVPAMYVGWSLLPDLGEAMESVRVAVCGAAPLDSATATRFTAATRHPVLVGYGLTETAPVVTSTLASPVPKVGSAGRPIPGVEVRLVSAGGDEVWRAGAPGSEWAEEERRRDFEPEAPDSPGSDPGEIVVRGSNLFSGYWPDGRDGPDPDGWWATGDVAYADGDGDLFLVDRLGELILVSGFNVYPREVELVLEAHPGIAEAAVLGVPHPYTGQTVKAYLVRARGSEVTAEEVMRHAERNLARFKCPTSVEFVDQLPHSATGKVRKAALRTEEPYG